MRILWLYSHIQHWMGGTRFIHEVCREFIKCGHDVTLVVENYSNELKKKFEEIAVNIKSLDTP